MHGKSNIKKTLRFSEIRTCEKTGEMGWVITRNTASLQVCDSMFIEIARVRSSFRRLRGGCSPSSGKMYVPCPLVLLRSWSPRTEMGPPPNTSKRLISHVEQIRGGGGAGRLSEIFFLLWRDPKGLMWTTNIWINSTRYNYFVRWRRNIVCGGVSENRVLRMIYGAKRDEVPGALRRLHNEKLNDLYCSQYIM
jgi:hypothetical protein